jgi:hypothetical protein
MPNGDIKFVNLTAAAMDKLTLDSFAEKINEVSKKLKETNSREAVDKNTKKTFFEAIDPYAANDINEELSNALYVALKTKGMAGMNVTLIVTPTGNIKVDFGIRYRDSNSSIKGEVYLYQSENDKSVPFELKDFDDLIARINKGIDEYNANPSNSNSTDKTKLKNIPIRLLSSSFKRSVMDNSEIGEYRQLLSSVGAAITKNPNLTITPKFKQNAPSNSSTTAATVDDIDEVPIPEDIAAQQVETMRKLAEAKRKKQEEEEKRKQQAGGAKNKNEKIAELRQAYDDRIREISNEKMAAGKTRAEVNRELRTVEDPKKGDPKILQILQEIAALQQGTANKIANNLTTSEVVDINEFTKWVEQNLPEFISVEDLKLMSRKMKQNGVTVGMFYTHMNNIKNQLEGRIAVGKKSPFKYHEAFHAVFRMLLPDDKIDELLSIAKKELLAKGESVADLKRKLLESKPEFYSQFSDIELEQRVYEEYLADRFDAWKRDIKTPTSSKNKGFFRYLWDLISGLFKAFRNSDSLENFFMKIEKGKYKKSQIASNRFTSESLVSVTEPALKVIKIGTDFIENEYGEMEEVPVYLGEEEGNVLSATVAALFHRKMMEAGLNAYNENILDEVIADYANLYDFNLNPYYDSDEFLERYENPVEFKKIEKKINDRFKIFTNPELIKIFKDAAMVHIKLMGYKEQIDEEEFERKVDEYGDRSSTDGRRETYTIGGYGSLSKELRLYLSTVVEEKADEFGNTMFINDKGEKTTQTIIEAANANVLYQGILKAVAGSVTEEQILERLRIFSESNPEAKKFWNKFSGDVDLVYDENGDFVDVGNKKQANLFQAVMKGFSQFCVDYLFINKDISKRKSRILEANRRGAARNQFSIWYNAYDNIFVEKFYHLDREKQDKFIDDRTKSLVYITNWFGSPLNPAVIDAKIQETIIGLKNDLGISLSPLYLKYSYLKSLPAEYFNDLTKPERAAQLRIINAYDGVTPLTKDDALQIAAVIKARKNPFGDNLDPSKLAAVEESTNPKAAHETPAESKENPLTDADSQQEERDVDDDVDGARGRLTNIAEGNAVFDEQVASTSHKNAEGEMVFSHQLPTFNLIRGAELRSEDFREKLKKDKFLTTNFLLNSPLFQAIASGFKIIRSDGLKDSSLSEIEDGKYKEDKRLNINQNKGITYGSMSPREFMITLLELYGRNKTYTVATENNKAKPFMTSAVLLGVLEASNTGDIAELPVIKSVLFDAKGNLKLTDEAKEALFNEVMREYDRITRVQTEISTGVYEKGIIDGYHTGDPNNKKNPGKRGLRFIKMRNMLGDRVAQLEEAAKQGLELTADEKSIIYQQIEEYWLGENGELNKFIKDLKKTNTIGQDKEGKYNNRLLNSFAFSGFWKDGKPDQIKNDLLNLSTTSFEYNMAQIVINNYINVLSVRQLFINDAAKNYKDDGGKDETKRNKGLNGAGPSSYAIITAPELGITHANKTSHVVTYEDNQYDGKYKGKRDSKEDGQMRMTVKALRYTLFGFGRLNQAQADLLDKIERGEDLKVSDIFGEEYKDAYGITRKKKGSIEFNAQTNSIKLVYNDGQNYIKISGVILTKQLTSIKDRRTGKWMARPETEELHNLREKLEDYESRNSTITFAVPKSGSKGLKTNVAKDINSINDDSFIEHDNRFWRLQLENPSNKIKITDPTQAKQMILSEQERDLVVHFKGENMKLGDVIDQYLSDTEQRTTNKYTAARNTIFDIKGAFRELKKSIKQSEITPKLGEFLNRAVGILEATGTDPQTIQFFTPTLNEKTGEYTPNYNLNHPITLEKFTQLFLAYFSRDVMNEKVPGHSVALMSNFGMKTVKRVVELDENGQPKRWEVITKRQYELDRDLLNEAILAKKWNNDLDRQFEGLNVGDLYIDDLRHNVPEYDEKGNIIGYFTEYMMPPHFEEDMREYLKTGVINDELLRAFGVRIPSQDKHSFVTLRLVDFMPANYGSTGVFPHELIEISGADFDIDKLYMHIVDSYKKNGKRIAYGTAVTNKDKFAEYVYYMAKKDRSVKAKMAELKKITAFYDETEDRYEIDGEIEPVTTYDDVQDLAHDLFSSEVSAKNMMEIIALKELGLPSNVDEYIKYVEDKGELNNGVLNNRILDAKIKLANNERMVLSKNGKTPIAFQVAETKPLEDIIDSFIERFPILHDILIEDSADVDSIRGQFYSFKNNKEGSRNIGPAVNAMLVYALMNAYKVQIRKQNAKGESMFVLNIDGKDFDSYGNSREWNDNTKTHDGERIAYHISAIVSAMTDNAKERLAARLGLNFNAIGVVSNMVALGVPLETAIMFNLQPSVREFYELISLTNNNIKTSEERDIYKKDVGENILKKINSKRSRKEEERLTFPVTTQLLEDNIKTVGDNADVDYSIFKTFFDFYKQTEAFSSVAQIMKLTQGLGTSNEDIDKIDEVEEKLGFNMPESEFLSSNIPFDVRQVLRGDNPSKPHNNIIAGLIRIKNEIKELQKSIMIERSYLYKRLYETVLENLHIHSKEETFEKTLKKDIIAYLGIKSYMNLLKTTGKGVKLSGLDNALIYDAAALQKGEEYEDIITAVQKMRETDPENAFLKFINAVPAGLKDIETGEMFRNPKGKFGINTLLVNTWASLDLAKINKIEDGLMELYSNVKTRPYVYKLFNYLLVKDGGQFKNGSFIRFMPPAMFKELLDATGNAQELLRYDNAIKDDEAYKEVFGATAMEIFNEFTKLYTTNANNSFNVKIVNPKATPDEKVERIPGYEPEVFKYNNDRIELDIFKGIRKKEPQLVTDENGNEFIMELVSTGKFTSDELKKLDFNNELLKAHGFNIVQKTDDKGKKKYYIALPYTIKIVVSDDLVNGRQFAYYKLSNVSKTKQDPNSPGIGNFIMDVGDNMALGSKAVYEKFEPEGARDQWKVGGLTGEMPTQKVLRDRYGKKKVGYDEVEYADDLEYYEAQLEGLPDFQLEEPVQDLDKDWGIKTKMMGNTVTYYKLVKGKEVVYDAKGAKSPQELLDRLNKEYQESGGKSAQGGELKNAYTEKVVPVEPTLPEVGENVDLSGQSEAATNKLKAMLAAKKGLSSEVNDQKNEKDKGCS